MTLEKSKIGKKYTVKTKNNYFCNKHKKWITYIGKLIFKNENISVFDTGKFRNCELTKTYDEEWKMVKEF